jgi:ribonuclease BN (tRNA processing enzyme)
MSSSITIYFLGTGTILSADYESCSSILMETTEEKILLDCGPGTLQQLHRRKILTSELTQVFITHFHPDHISDLIPLLFTLANLPQDPITMVQVWGPPGFDQFMEGMSFSYGSWLQSSRFKYSEMKSSPLLLKNFRVIWLKVNHSPESIGYRFEFKNHSVSFSGDSGYCPELITLAKNADLAIMECSYPDDRARENHLTPSQVGEIALRANPARLAITHLYPETLAVSPLETIRKFYAGKSFLSRDMEKVELVD